MRSALLAAFSFGVIVFTVGSAHGQLGPKDGAHLAPTEIERVKVGQPAPDFTLENLDGRIVSLSNFRGQKSVVLVFYRGQW